MIRTLTFLASLLLVSLPASAQASAFQDPLLERLAGKWLLQGTIGGKPTTHEVAAEWVLNHQYLRLHEVSRETGADGKPAYEAIVFIGWDRAASEYQCLWLDSTGSGGLATQVIGHARPDGDEIPFLFVFNGNRFHTTFAYDRAGDAWQWRMDGEESGSLQPFARVTLRRR